MMEKTESSSRDRRSTIDATCEAVSTELAYPWLVYSHGMYSQKQTFYSLLNDRYDTKIIPKMRNKDICFSDHGWVLLQDYISNRYSLFNMITMDEEIQLPHLPDPVVAYNCKILTSSPSDSNNCRIMFIDGYSERCIMLCSTCDNDRFVKHYFKIIGDDGHFDFLNVAIYMNGKIYGLTLPSYDLIVADHHDMRKMMMNSSSSTTVRFHKLTRDNESSLRKTLPSFLTARYLTECNGDLLLVLVTFFGPDENVTGIRLFRADHSTKDWTEVKSIGNRHAIFLDGTRAFSFSSCGADIKGNFVYLVEKEDRSLYTYSLEDESITMTLPCHLSATFTTSESDDSMWIFIPPLTNKKKNLIN